MIHMVDKTEKNMIFPQDFTGCVFRIKTAYENYVIGQLLSAEQEFMILDDRGTEKRIKYSDVESCIIYYPFHHTADYIIFFPFQGTDGNYWINKKLIFGAELKLISEEADLDEN